jgi:hypothetical protein
MVILQWVKKARYILLDTATFEALSIFLCRPWFSRLWIIQEVYFAGKDTMLQCGTMAVEWQKARIAMTVLNWKAIGYRFDDGSDQKTYMNRVMAMHTNISRVKHLIDGAILDTGFQRGYHYLDLCTSTRNSQSSDPRDRVFALQTLVQPGTLTFEPNYTTTPAHVFKDTVLCMMGRPRHLEFLGLCDLTDHDVHGPSWVPNFARLVNRIYPTLRERRCYGTLRQKPEVIDDVLFATGRTLPRIQAIYRGHSTNPWSIPPPLRTQMLFDLFMATGAQEDSTVMKNLLKALVTRYTKELLHPDQLHSRSDYLIHELTTAFANAKLCRNLIELQEQKLMECITGSAVLLENRDIFIDEKGHFGLCPRGSKVDDLLVMLLSCSTPLVLRPQIENSYLMVGDAFHPEYMEGEAWLGPLPGHIRPVWRESYQQWTYFDQRSGKMHGEDPRLGILPMGWMANIVHEQKPWLNAFVHDSVGDKYSAWDFDPRTTPEELEKRGVQLQEFRLV